MFTGSNLDCLHLTQPAKLISNYGGSLQICRSTQTQNWTNRLRACGGICLCFNTVAKFAFFFSSKFQTTVDSGIILSTVSLFFLK